MNYDTVYINGCSFFAYPWDWESSKRTSTNKEVVKLQFYPKEKRKELLKKYNFGWHLKENLNIKNYVNEASPGKSNEKIIRELKQYLLTSKLKNSIVILGLTQSCRYNVPSEGGNYITNKFYIEPNKDKYEILNNKNQCSHKEYIQFNQLRDKVYFSTEHYIRELELELDIIDKLLKTDNNKLIVINNLLEEDLDLYMVERKKYGQGRFALFKEEGLLTRDPRIESKPYIMNLKGLLGGNIKNWPEFIKSYDITYDSEGRTHPNSEDHKILAKKIIQYI